mgnify:CR=1 FL=1
MKEMKFRYTGELSEEAKVKLDKLKLRKETTLKNLQDDYDSGKFDDEFKNL